MKARTLGLILCLIGTVGALIGYISIGMLKDISFLKMGILGNFIQLVGLFIQNKGRQYENNSIN